MAKTYPLKALRPLLPFKRAAPPLLATLDAYDDGLVKYAVTQDGVWLFSLPQPLTMHEFSLPQPLTEHEFKSLTGFDPDDLVLRKIEGVEGYFYALQGGAPLLPIPFTKDQFIEFDKRTADLIDSCIDRGDDTDAWITDLEKRNPDAAELARGIHGGKWPLDLADIVDTKPESVVASTKRQTWRDVAMEYVVGVYKAGQYATTKHFYKALLDKAGTDDSPFQKGTGENSGSLFVQVISKPLSLKTLENAMPKIRQAAK